jgi:uncharacterized protein
VARTTNYIRNSHRRVAAMAASVVVATAVAVAGSATPAAADGSTNGGERSLTAATITENFDGLSNLTTVQSAVPAGVQLLELGTGGAADGLYVGNDGLSNAGNLYSYGSAGSGERALGSLNSGTNDPRFGLLLRNNSGQTVTDLSVSYTGEHWRRGGTARTD